GVEAITRSPARREAVAQALGGAGERGGRVTARGRVELAGRALGQAHYGEGQARVEVSQLLDGWVRRGLRLEGFEGSLVVLVAVTHEADVVAETLRVRSLREALGEERLGEIVALLGEVGDAEEIAHGKIFWVDLARLFEHLDRLIEPPLGHVDQPHVV